ncbi:MAG: hypothetical protein NTV05_03640 [Acidobacteria bacterium]|nr:hypothetical protein [Acidobacteriota bacterium]
MLHELAAEHRARQCFVGEFERYDRRERRKQSRHFVHLAIDAHALFDNPSNRRTIEGNRNRMSLVRQCEHRGVDDILHPPLLLDERPDGRGVDQIPHLLLVLPERPQRGRIN